MPLSKELRPDQDESTGDSLHTNSAQKLNAAEQAALDQLSASYSNKDDVADPAHENANIERARALDNAPQPTQANSGWDTNVQGRDSSTKGQRRFAKALGFLGKRKGVVGTIATVLVGGGVLVGVFGPATMLINLTQNLAIGNDSSSVAMERRFAKVFQNAIAGDGLCQGKIKCNKMGRISNSALRSMTAKGITPIINNAAYNPGRTGYPSQNPTHYEIDGPDGAKRRVPAANLTNELLNDRRLASRVLGTGGAFNLRVRAWTGKHISQRLFSNIPGFTKNGGIAANEHKGKPAAERERVVRQKATENNRIAQRTATASVTSTAEKTMRRAGKAGPVYTTAMATCVATKAPRYFAAAYAGAQLLQILPLITDIVLSPGDKNKAAGFGSGFDPDDAAAAGTILNDRYPNKEGDLKSALDSAIFLAALGINKNRVDTSRAPGMGLLSSPAMQSGMAIDDAAEESCNVIMRQDVMYGAMAADMAVTVAASATIIGGIIKIAGGFIVTQIATEIVLDLLKKGAESAIQYAVESEDIPGAKGEELGDWLGFGAMALFSSGGMARSLPTLNMSQVSSFNAMRQENEQFQKEMDIASLSPFDISSRHTFLGSIVHTMGVTMLRNGTYSTSISSALANLMRLPAMAFSYGSHANAATNLSVEYCGYAEDFGLMTPNPSDAPAINAAGLPCTGITPEQDSMSTVEAIDLLVNEGWLIDDDEEIPDDASISDLIDNGTIVADTPMMDFIEMCGDATSGDYLFNSAGCTVGGSGDVAGGIHDIEIECQPLDDGSTVCATDSEDFGAGSDLPDLKNSRSLLAISVFLIDYQIMQSINGQDEEQVEQGGVPITGDDSIDGLPEAVGNIVSPIPPDMEGKIRTSARYGRYPSGGPHWGIDLTGGGDNGWDFVSVCDGVVDSVRINQRHANSNAFRTSGSTNYVWIKCDNGVYMGYAHFYANRLRSYITPGYRISAGTPIAPQGNQGNSTGAHLHFQINPNSSSGYSAAATVDPAAYLQRLGVTLPRASY